MRDTSRIIVSNPYELHQVLTWHYQWERFWAGLNFWPTGFAIFSSFAWEYRKVKTGFTKIRQ